MLDGIIWFLKEVGGPAVVIGVLAALLGKLLVNRELEQLRQRGAALLEAQRTEWTKELFVHRSRFAAEFEVYRNLWRGVLAVGRAASDLGRELDIDSGEPFEARVDKFRQAHNDLNAVTYDNRPFYVPRVYELTKELLSIARKVRRNHLRPARRTPEQADKLWEKIEQGNEGIQKLVEDICEAIRKEVWNRDAGASGDSGNTHRSCS